ncbi:Uma2 family endonuclease [Longimycelium tulufanense]|uniref:Uma2 family endonuclease n=1 Tax=Longimycelium tulufanense TaxID=907463 RepID=UPI001663067B|nr:Uma2 family endonuclease [Longimycelium tulufanense]
MTAALQDMEDHLGPFRMVDWLSLPEREDGSRVELIFGELCVSPLPAMHHQFVGDELRELLKHTFRTAGRSDLYVVTAVGTELGVELRNCFIPDIVVIDMPPVGHVVGAKNLVMAVEVWSPGNTPKKRDEKMRGYAAAGVPYLWTVEFQKPERQTQDPPSLVDTLTVTAYQLKNGRYILESVARVGETATITAAPVPVMFDPDDLLP